MKTVDTILKKFRKTISELESLAERETRHLADKRNLADKYIREANEHATEANRARTVASRIANFIDVDNDSSPS